MDKTGYITVSYNYLQITFVKVFMQVDMQN